MTFESAILALRPGAIWELRGGTYDGLVWRDQSPMPTRAEVEAKMAEAEPTPIPEKVSLRQFRMALRRAGMFEAVNALKTSELLTTQQKTDVEDFLEYSNEIERAHPMIASLAPLVGVTPEQIDDIFRAASSL